MHGSGRIAGEVKSAARWRAVLARMQQEGAPLCAAQLRCTGADIMEWLNLPASPRVGEIKRALMLHCACHPRDNEPGRLKKIAKILEDHADENAAAHWHFHLPERTDRRAG